MRRYFVVTSDIPYTSTRTSVRLNLKILNLPNLQKPNLESTERPVCSFLPNIETTKSPKTRTQPRTLLNRMAKMDDFLEAFSSKLNPKPAEPLICPQKLNLEHTEPPKTKLNLEPS